LAARHVEASVAGVHFGTQSPPIENSTQISAAETQGVELSQNGRAWHTDEPSDDAAQRSSMVQSASVAQVAAQIPWTQVLPSLQPLPQVPPQPSEPHSHPAHCGSQNLHVPASQPFWQTVSAVH
jgi:hypothetical protein